jgi:hypothetical protein
MHWVGAGSRPFQRQNLRSECAKGGLGPPFVFGCRDIRFDTVFFHAKNGGIPWNVSEKCQGVHFSDDALLTVSMWWV